MCYNNSVALSLFIHFYLLVYTLSIKLMIWHFDLLKLDLFDSMFNVLDRSWIKCKNLSPQKMCRFENLSSKVAIVSWQQHNHWYCLKYFKIKFFVTSYWLPKTHSSHFLKFLSGSPSSCMLQAFDLTASFYWPVGYSHWLKLKL